jgi:hypothetical protein
MGRLVQSNLRRATQAVADVLRKHLRERLGIKEVSPGRESHRWTSSAYSASAENSSYGWSFRFKNWVHRYTDDFYLVRLIHSGTTGALPGERLLSIEPRAREYTYPPSSTHRPTRCSGVAQRKVAMSRRCEKGILRSYPAAALSGWAACQYRPLAAE